jgi:hypothetical protein
VADGDAPVINLTSATLGDVDFPNQLMPLTSNQKETVEEGDDLLVERKLRLGFELDIVGQTTEAVLGSETVYTRLYTTDWSWQADSVTTWDSDPLFGLDWEASFLPGAGIFPGNTWTPLTDGSRPYSVGAPTFNDELDHEGFE